MTELQKLTKKQKRLRKDLNEVNSEIRMIKMGKGLVITDKANELINRVSQHFCLDREYLISNSREKEKQVPKRLIYYILKNKYNFPLANIGGIFRFNHASIIYGLKQFEEQRQDNKYINDLIKVFYEN